MVKWHNTDYFDHVKCVFWLIEYLIQSNDSFILINSIETLVFVHNMMNLNNNDDKYQDHSLFL
ncbi:hypothetical protein AB733_24010 [Photobacterium swingsii]|uniref:Uncharacterized protein n=1 Tax=Photobacterium swingsii TaxID=680026 RepID=A0A0J8V4Y5_9GAMM|nr:hypothetical protein AB733_24010 [Photobacterium swingsii]PSW23189.1 hypothetical protein C9I94_16325 [Photobacterium swingsii]